MKFKKLNSKIPGGKARSVMTLEATVENKPQPLRKLRSSFMANVMIPGHLCGEAQIVLKALFSCFEKQGNVQEGLIGDLMWGFEQCAPPVPRQLTFKGLANLAAAGYVKFQAPDNSFVDIMSDQIGKAWVRYQPKLLDMAYEGPSK